MKKYFSLFIGILVLSGISCTKEFEDKGNVETPAGAGVTFTAEIIAETPQTAEKQSASKVAWNAFTRWWGNLAIKPTVSESTTSKLSDTFSCREVVSRVSNSRLLAGMPASVS